MLIGKTIQNLKQELQKKADKEQAKNLQRFFKTGKGEYGEGDIFLGVMVPEQRKIAKEFSELPLTDLSKLIKSKIHEERLICLFILVNQFQKGNDQKQEEIYRFYLKHTKHINNWDLVDLSAPKIVGAYLEDKDKFILYKLAKSKNIWDKRIAILSTFYFIYKGRPEDTLKIALILKNDDHDLIHKAVGWMLREVGKKCGQNIEEKFLRRYYKEMPRTMLRYAIEKFPEKKRKFYLGKD